MFVNSQHYEHCLRKNSATREEAGMTETASTAVNRTLRRLPNASYRPREYLTEAEVERLIEAARKRRLLPRAGRSSAAQSVLQDRIFPRHRHGEGHHQQRGGH